MVTKLSLHPSALSSAAAKLLVSAEAALTGCSLTLTFKIKVDEEAPRIVWPLASSEGTSLSEKFRRDELWKSTCMEAFILFEDKSYIELNFAPTGEWNAYHFDSYRNGMKPETRLGKMTDFKSARSSDTSSTNYLLSVTVDLAQAVKSSQHFRLGLTCVIETDSGERSYWSLKHSGEKPDFHDSRGHILDMRISRVAT